MQEYEFCIDGVNTHGVEGLLSMGIHGGECGIGPDDIWSGTVEDFWNEYIPNPGVSVGEEEDYETSKPITEIELNDEGMDADDIKLFHKLAKEHKIGI